MFSLEHIVHHMNDSSTDETASVRSRRRQGGPPLALLAVISFGLLLGGLAIGVALAGVVAGGVADAAAAEGDAARSSAEARDDSARQQGTVTAPSAPHGGQQVAADPSTTMRPPSPPPSGATYVFPVAGTYTFGTAIDSFGAPRPGHMHQGQDILAQEGTPVVSVSAGTVHQRSYQEIGAGNYVVIRGTDGFDYVYQHLRSQATVAKGEPVVAGQRIGDVGRTGRRDPPYSPHLHFEVWDGPWKAGGHPVDPLPRLRNWTSPPR